MKKGLTDITNVMRGTTQITKVMRGTTLIWQKTLPLSAAWLTSITDITDTSATINFNEGNSVDHYKVRYRVNDGIYTVDPEHYTNNPIVFTGLPSDSKVQIQLIAYNADESDSKYSNSIIFYTLAIPTFRTITDGMVITANEPFLLEVESYPEATSVAYYSGTYHLGTGNTAPYFPYTVPAHLITEGSFSLTARATVNGQVYISDPLTVNIEAASNWAQDVADAYETRVLADYGTVEDKAALITYLES